MFVSKQFVYELFVNKRFAYEQFGNEQYGVKGGFGMCEKECPGNMPKCHIGKIVHELDNLLYRNMVAMGKKYNYDQVTVMNGWILRYLSLNKDKEIYQKDIENEFGITKSTVAGIIKLMEQKGFIQRISVPQDARLKKLVLTDKGLEYEEKMEQKIQEYDRSLKENITEEEMETFLRVIDKIKQNVKE